MRTGFTPYLLGALLLGGCSMIPAFERPAVQTPAQWKNAPTTAGLAATPAPMAANWWRSFGSDELSLLVEQGLAQNNDMQAAIARVQQARASARIAGSSLLPSLDASASAGRSDTNRASASTDYRVGTDIAYEVDLFGGNRANATSAQASLLATEFTRDALSIVVASDIAQAYFEILTLRDQLRIARENLAAQQDVLTIVQARFNEGLNSALEVAQQRAQFENSSASLAEQERALATRENGLAILLGIPPAGLMVEAVDLTAISIPEATPPLPSVLIEARPDIKAAEANLRAANADIGAARAAFFPVLNLGAGLTASFDPTLYANSLAASALAPIFRGGALQGGLELSEAREREVVEAYRKTVLTSFQEVEDALAFIRSANIRLERLRVAADESQRAYALSREQYTAGAIDFQALLDTQRSKLQSDNAYAGAKQDVLLAALALIKATGAGWKPGEKQL